MPVTEAAEPHENVDPERTRPQNPFDASTGYSGQDYSREREETEGRKQPSGHPIGGDTTAVDAPPGGNDGDIPPDNGRRGGFDPATGEVFGSGAGAGGGNEGEDFDADRASGAG